MCGLAGGFSSPGANGDASRLRDAVQRMCLRMRNRGPDGSGLWSDGSGQVCLGHRRLAILDLDARANQPMLADNGSHAIVFNGEIYNFRELRAQLQVEGVHFRTSSDTEVLLAMYQRYGTAMLTQLRGMFALAIWERAGQRVLLARDPYGIKPLYVARAGEGWLFASQVKALLESGWVSREPDALGQAGFWLLGSVAEPRTWFRDISSLAAGHFQWLTAAGAEDAQSYWDVGSAWRDAPEAIASDDDIAASVSGALNASVSAHLVSDVPVGVFLSGGIDSGSLAALMHDAGAIDMQGITIAFSEFAGSRDDEVPVAARIASQYGINHHVRLIERVEFEQDLPAILDSMDQPSIDGINTWYASKAVAELGLKVVVSGVGGDELFQGYSSFRELPALVSRWQAASRIPGMAAFAKAMMAVQSARTGNPRWQLLPRLSRSMAGAWFLRRGVFSPAELPGLMGNELAAHAFGALDPEAFVLAMTGSVATDPMLGVGQIESMTYLRNQLLRDSDWASMAHSVELRTPLVDAWLLRDLQPVLRALHRFPSKRLLARAPSRPLPDDIANRSKTGFGTPVSAWLAQMPRGDTPVPSGRVGSALARRVAHACYAS